LKNMENYRLKSYVIELAWGSDRLAGSISVAGA